MHDLWAHCDIHIGLVLFLLIFLRIVSSSKLQQILHGNRPLVLSHLLNWSSSSMLHCPSHGTCIQKLQKLKKPFESSKNWKKVKNWKNAKHSKKLQKLKIYDIFLYKSIYFFIRKNCCMALWKFSLFLSMTALTPYLNHPWGSSSNRTWVWCVDCSVCFRDSWNGLLSLRGIPFVLYWWSRWSASWFSIYLGMSSLGQLL